MQQNAKISHESLRSYFEADFARGKDFGPAWNGDQLVESNETDFLGAPKLKAAFANFMDNNDSDACASYGDMVGIYDGMKRQPGGTDADDRMNFMHGALSWLAFDRRAGVTQEQYAERKGVTERTVRRWIDDAIKYVARQLRGEKGPGSIIIFPASYEAAPRTAAGE